MNQILGIGHDLIEIHRIESVHQQHGDRFLHRIFTVEEIDYCFTFRDPYPSLAARFAAKEAVSKAFGTGIGHDLNWKDIEIQREASGKPILALSDLLKKKYSGTKVLITLSHTKEMASAFAVWVRD